MRCIGIDLGSTYLKGAVLDTARCRLTHIRRSAFPSPIQGLGALRREYDPDQVVAAARELLKGLSAVAPDAVTILVCSQLHGLVFCDDRGTPQGNVITWQDQRALEVDADEQSSFQRYRDALSEELLAELGNEPRPGTPVNTLLWLQLRSRLPPDGLIAAPLPSFVISALSGEPPRTDPSHACGHGLLNIAEGSWHRGALDALGLTAVRLPEIVPSGSPIAAVRICGRDIPTLAPIGDFQCSQIGALLEHEELGINISTGSAVIQRQFSPRSGNFQVRPFIDGEFARTVTHIPGGRALKVLVTLLTELGGRGDDPWPYINSQAERADPAGLMVSPSFYYSAVGNTGSILGARESNLNVGSLFRATYVGMAENYYSCAKRLCPIGDVRRLVFSGGVAMKNGLLRQIITERFGCESRLAPSPEDTLLGLLVCAVAHAETAGSVTTAIERVRTAMASDTTLP